MAIKSFFKGKTSKRFWTNIALMAAVVIAVPVIAFYMLDIFTHHGEKIEVPSVTGKLLEDAETMLQERELVAVVNDSVYDKYAAPGAVLDQMPRAGYEVKAGRVIYLTVAMRNMPTVALPDVVGHGSMREAEATLSALGFKLTAPELVEGKPLELVVGVKQGGKEVYAGDMIPRDKPLTLLIGAGEVDSLMMDGGADSTDVDVEVDDEFAQ